VVRFTRPSHAPGLELVHYPNLTRGWRGIPEAYRWFTLIDWLEGDVEVITRGVRAPCAAGSVTIGEPGEPYVIRPHTPMRGGFRVVRIYNDVLEALIAEIEARRPEDLFPREPQRDASLARAFRRLYHAIEDGDTLERQERLVAFLTTLAKHGGHGFARTGGRITPGVRRAQDLLHDRFDASLTLDALAEAAGTDKFALLRAFSRELGITPHAYQVQLRMARACQLIARQVPLAEVALAVGYSEQSALQRPFKRLVGVTPGAYARARR
jgi:AraC-like DNA-binding protein